MSQIPASSLAGLRPVQPGQIISANLINVLIDAHIQLERRLRTLEQREPDRPPQGGGGVANPVDTGVVINPKDIFKEERPHILPSEETFIRERPHILPSEETFIRERQHVVGPAIEFAEIVDTDDGPMAVITGMNLRDFDSVKLGEIAVDTSKAEVTEGGMRIPLKGQAEIVRAIQDTGAISSVSISGRDGMAAKTVQFNRPGKGGRVK